MATSTPAPKEERVPHGAPLAALEHSQTREGRALVSLPHGLANGRAVSPPTVSDPKRPSVHRESSRQLGEKLLEKRETGEDNSHVHTHRNSRMPVLARAKARPRIPLPMMALLRLKEDIPKGVVPGCWWQSVQGEHLQALSQGGRRLRGHQADGIQGPRHQPPRR